MGEKANTGKRINGANENAGRVPSYMA